MVTATKNNTNSSLNSTYASSASRSTSELYKADNSKTTSKSETSKSEDFKEVLNSKANSREDDVKKVDSVDKDESSTEVKDTTTKLDELKEKLKELDEDSESTSKDDVNETLNELLNLLAKLGIKEEDLKSNGEINSDVLKKMLEGVNLNESSTGNLSSTMEQLMKLLKTDSVKDGLDTDSLKLMEKLLSNLSAKLTDDSAEGTKDVKSSMKNLMSEISNILDNKQNQSGKVLTLEDMLNKNYSQDSKDGSLENDSNKKTTSENTKDVSKENKFLSSLIDNNKDDSTNKINLFASRNQPIQNQAVDTAQGLTINKANFAEDLIKDVKFMSNNGLKELTVKVNPGNLGEITIKIVQEDGLMKANLKANSKETTALLSQNIVEIKKQLGEQNIKIADVNIELYQEDTTFFKDQGFGRQLSEEQGRNNNNSNGNSVNSGVISDEELQNNIISNDSNIEFFA